MLYQQFDAGNVGGINKFVAREGKDIVITDIVATKDDLHFFYVMKGEDAGETV